MDRDRLVPLLGVLFLVLLIVGFAVQGGEPPEASDGAAEVVEHYVDNKDSVIVGSVIATIAMVPLLFFAGYLRRVLSAAGGRDDSMLPGLVLVGASIIAVGVAIDTTISFALAEAAEDVDEGAVLALQALWDNDFLPIALGSVVFLFSLGIGIVQTGALPKWVGWIAIALAVIGLSPIGFVSAIGAALLTAGISIALSVSGKHA